VAGVREERAPVSGGAVLRLEVEAREVAAARRRSGEGKSWVGEKNLAGGGGSVLKGSGGEGAEGWAPCGGGAGEREGERGAWRVVEQRDGVA
jgi:hypothetical protein